MIAIVLAAGRGRRLHPLTQRYPKPLVPLPNDTTPLDLLVEGLRRLSVSRIVVVRSDPRVAPPGCELVDADGSGNMVHTLMSALDTMRRSNEDLLVSYADLVLEHRVLRSAANPQRRADISVLADTGWERYYRWRFDGALGDAETFVLDDEGFVAEVGRPLQSGVKPPAQYVGVLNLTQNGLGQLADEYQRCNDVDVYMTSVLDRLIQRGVRVAPILVDGGWLELDTYNDYLKAVAVVSQAEVVEFFDAHQIGAQG